VLGGLAAVAGGGKFANGALTAAFGYLFNATMKCMAAMARGCSIGMRLATAALPEGAGAGCAATGPYCPAGAAAGAAAVEIAGCAAGAGAAYAVCNASSDDDESSENSDKPKSGTRVGTRGLTMNECIKECLFVLPTTDFGVEFQRCVNQCMGDNDYEEWRKYFPPPRE
jgi:hypothetical protein